MSSGGHQHRPGKLKQSNKEHKSGRHETRGAIKRKADGKLSAVSRTSVKDRTLSKDDRKIRNKQLAQQKREASVESKRLGNSQAPPKIVGVVSLAESVDTQKIWELLSGSSDSHHVSNTKCVTARYPAWRQRFTLLKTDPADLNSVLDAAKVADLLLLVIPTTGTDSRGEQTISSIKAQGMPTIMGIIQGLEAVPLKHRKESRRNLTKFMEEKFPGEPKVFPLDNTEDSNQVVRYIANGSNRLVQWRERRPYLVVDSASFQASETESTRGTVSISGFLRGHSLDANCLIHIPDHGDYQIIQIEVGADPYLPSRTHKDSAMETDSSNKKIIKPNPSVQENLIQENEPDFMNNEQTWPTDAEIKEAEEARKKLRRVPKGTSKYQAAWIVESDEEDGHAGFDDENSDEEQYNNDSKMEEDTKEEEKVEEKEEEKVDEEEEEEEMEEIDMNKEDEKSEPKNNSDSMFEDAKEDEIINGAQRTNKFERSEEDLEFPDEVLVPEDTPARLRFQKYRGLKSLRSSNWDPKENLPVDYARIFQFSNFQKTKKRVLTQDSEESVKPGQYVTIQLANAPAAIVDNFRSIEFKGILIAGGLLKYENKISVLNFVITKHHSYTEPVQSKEALVFHCGFRRYLTFPIFSENSMRSDKFKYEKFLQPGRNSVATIFGPITFPTVPLLVYKPNTNQLVATGSLSSVDPDRIVLKRIILTGYPFKIHKRVAVVRDMFYDVKDIQWFKPVELWTKYGRTGHIKETLGTHGHMKCMFDEQIRANDTICLTLYKRTYPIWTNFLGDRPEAKPSEKERIRKLKEGFSSTVNNEALAPLPLPKVIEKKIRAAKLKAIQKKEKSSVPLTTRNGVRILNEMPIFDDGLDDDDYDYGMDDDESDDDEEQVDMFEDADEDEVDVDQLD
eukprot:TRINITY_DN2222_c0_g2_i1.p1 TRINITY_DN2222_c0_g2~~TRINITY_DN2222_c0_g2_i1.p1  ORF type:complete len:903 (-),score=390.56 TRINITY_DN2222_c0_g2_i1:46-2754(-)